MSSFLKNWSPKLAGDTSKIGLQIENPTAFLTGKELTTFLAAINKKLLGAGIATRSILTTSNKKLVILPIVARRLCVQQRQHRITFRQGTCSQPLVFLRFLSVSKRKRQLKSKEGKAARSLRDLFFTFSIIQSLPPGTAPTSTSSVLLTGLRSIFCFCSMESNLFEELSLLSHVCSIGPRPKMIKASSWIWRMHELLSVFVQELALNGMPSLMFHAWEVSFLTARALPLCFSVRREKHGETGKLSAFTHTFWTQVRYSESLESTCSSFNAF